MIANLRIQRFKCFEDQSIKFGNLTLLVGSNATGKSTVIQTLLLLRQSKNVGALEAGELLLNGQLVNIGTASDAIYSQSKEDLISFSLTKQDETEPITFEFIYPRGKPDVHTIFSKRKLQIRAINLFDKHLTYLNAERLGPRLLYPMADVSRDEMNVGIQGEFTAHCLSEFGNSPLSNDLSKGTFGNPALAYPDEDNLSLRYQTELWMRRIIPNVDIDIIPISEADQVRMGLKNQGLSTDYLRPTNIGFGISYTLPIIVAALMSKPGDILIVENPEAHLHPLGQSEMGKFLVRAAAAGIQIVVESHSDHILNGIRLAVRRGIVSAKDVSIQFFSHKENETNLHHKEIEYQVSSPILDSKGKIDVWPEGFFDQIEKDLMDLF